jgi:uncharacterized protein YchJ
MIKYFIDKKDEIKGVRNILELLNSLKIKIENDDFTDSEKDFSSVTKYFDTIHDYALQNKNEELANSNFVFKVYFLIFVNLSEYFKYLNEKKYRESWLKLQDIFDDIRNVCRFTNENYRFELLHISELLKKYEELYPFTVFSSPEYIIKKSKCTICEKSKLSLECMHITGNIYWGKLASEIIEEADIRAIAVVPNPKDKRLYLEASDKNISENDRFIKLQKFLSIKLSFLQLFNIQSYITYKNNDSIKKNGRNDKCSCGSGLKYKNCCLNKQQYPFTNYVIEKKEMIKLIILGSFQDKCCSDCKSLGTLLGYINYKQN